MVNFICGLVSVKLDSAELHCRDAIFKLLKELTGPQGGRKEDGVSIELWRCIGH